MPVSGTVVDRIEILRLHTDESDCVWYGDDDQLAINSYFGAENFFDEVSLGCELDSVKCIRFLGTKANAPLVVALQQRRAANPTLNKRQRIQLCSPSVVPTEAMRAQPEEVLQHLWQPTYSSALSGFWHDMENSDFCSYMMVHHMASYDGVPEVVHRIAPYHPAWLAVAYLKKYDADAACKLIGEIVDPRWYRHPFRPNRCTKLFAHLGLTPNNVAAYLGEARPERHFDRACLAIASWYNVQQPAEGFLWRQFSSQESKVKGLLKATQRFVSFLRAVWMYGVGQTHPEASFSPEMFFADEIEAHSFSVFKSAYKAV